MQTAKADPSLLQSARNTEVGERFNRTLFAALDALEERKIGYALIGGVASSGLGRPRSTHDIDVFVRPEDAGSALDALARKGFRTEKTDFNWLFKAFNEDILVDIIFKSRGDIYFDVEMSERAKPVEYHGRKVRTVSPEDLVIIKCAVHDEIGPHHWHDALAVLSHAQMDWDYLVRRARKAPRRLLSLLLYAQSNDIWIPNRVVFELFKTIYGDSTIQMPPPAPSFRVLDSSAARQASDHYLVARIREALAQDARTGDQDLRVTIEGSRLLLRGEVVSEEHKRDVEQVVRECAPGHQISNQLSVSVLSEPSGSEDVG